MSALVTDTHTLLWYLFDPPLLSTAARDSFVAAEATGAPIHVPAIVLVELRYLVEKGKFTEAQYQAVARTLNNTALLPVATPLDIIIADAMAQIPRHVVPDIPDRIIAATALRWDYLLSPGTLRFAS